MHLAVPWAVIVTSLVLGVITEDLGKNHLEPKVKIAFHQFLLILHLLL